MEEVYAMYNNNLQNQARREMKEVELQVNKLIYDYEVKWKQHWTHVSLIPISEIKNNLPYNLQKGGRIQFYLTLEA